MKGQIILMAFCVLATSSSQAFPSKSQIIVRPNLARATPEQFLEAAIQAATGISTALETAALDIHNALTGDAALAASVQSILDVAYNNAGGILIPALSNLEAAATDEEAEVIVQDTMSQLMYVGLDTEFKVEDAMATAEAGLQEAVHSISATLTKEIKVQIKPLWDLTQTKFSRVTK